MNARVELKKKTKRSQGCCWSWREAAATTYAERHANTQAETCVWACMCVFVCVRTDLIHELLSCVWSNIAAFNGLARAPVNWQVCIHVFPWFEKLYLYFFAFSSCANLAKKALEFLAHFSSCSYGLQLVMHSFRPAALPATWFAKRKSELALKSTRWWPRWTSQMSRS